MDRPIEKWKDIEGHEGLYQVSDLGRIKSLYKERINGRGGIRKYPEKILKEDRSAKYSRVVLHDNKRTRCSIHRLVALTFIPNPLNLPEVNHKNGKKWDNRKVNLEWSTGSSNVKHAFDTGLKISKKGNEVWCSKLTKKQVLKIRKRYKGRGKGITEKQLGSEFNVCLQTISDIVNKKSWNHV